MARKTESPTNNLVLFEERLLASVRAARAEIEIEQAKEPAGKTYRHLRLLLNEPQEPQQAA